MKKIVENKTQMVLLGLVAFSLVGFLVSNKKYRNFFGATDTNQIDEYDVDAEPYIPFESF